ncbi:indolepyruvate ferredoxin oxidoreductase family protein [Bradyrhizobium neotropicale]|uniref:indolepyruvate ferredoxin oxidoreductase family protein n=1 Tax=Bradyrhizobium neotropicale TaxID=1497615 RepID=UPI001AD6F2F8|nr:indolepyruvate ferredoxin oxidoreductase family protein [Bradyrhizobium neotropicale]MBO4221739.1 indolepyruvate ferredoxin oxidoreductase family protein [Bradyrhizobium neotropicale]
MTLRETATRVDLDYRLHDAITKTEGRVFASGTQALVRMLVMQRLADRRDGIHSAGFVSGYRGSPLAGVDTELWRAKSALADHDIRFLPGINEDLAATAVSGTQRVADDPNRTVEGVFALWYGKGPGVDRAGDAIRHGHAAGASVKGGVVLVVGDDHAATSSSIPNASDMSLMGWGIPIVHPASVDEYVEFGLWSWAASRFSGAWVAFKAISETVESSRGFTVPVLPRFAVPSRGGFPEGGLGYATRDFLTPAIELRIAHRLEAIAAFARANPLDRMPVDVPGADIGIVAVGKNAKDVLEVFERAGLSQQALAEKGVRIWRPGLTFPLDRDRLGQFAHGLKHILVVEEKVNLVEGQIKDAIFNWPADRRPSISGRGSLDGSPLITALGQHRSSSLAPPLSAWLSNVRPDLAFSDRLGLFERSVSLSNAADGMRRLPYFCSGCPHNSSTRIPAGSIALAGVGCHYMASWMDRQTSGLTQMGAEGVDWVGQAAFTTTPHVFQNMGEGTYFHSGHLAIRQSIAAGHNITYKILFNDAVAMTGGQPVDGQLTVPQIARQVASEGAKRVVIVTDDTARYAGTVLDEVTIHDRLDLDPVQRELRAIKGVTVLIYDQTCAAEKRRRRKKGAYPDPARRMFINSAVCEGCGDCGTASNCLSIVPLETDLGRKRAIDQTSCNKDFSCVEGFCPSFVSVLGGGLRKQPASGRDWIAHANSLPRPSLELPDGRPHNLLVAGVGGSGIITVGAIIAMAAHLDGLEVAELDFTALAQKGGSVMCHLRIAASGSAINQPRIDWGEADGVVMGDLIVGCLPDSLGTVRKDRTRILVNTHLGSTAEFTRDPDADPRRDDLLAKVRHAAGADSVSSFDAQQLAQEQFGETTGANMILVGHAWQQGLIPVSEAAMIQAITLNGVAVDANMRAFACGRVVAAQGIPACATQSVTLMQPERWEALVDRRADELTRYQNASYATSYQTFVAHCAAMEQHKLKDANRFVLTKIIASALFKLMAYKDEYEVARLYSRPEFIAALRQQFEGDFELRFHLAPPFLARPRAGSAVPQKIAFGPWMLRAFAVLARLRVLRGTVFDPFGYTEERLFERRLIDDYKALVDRLLAGLSPATLDIAAKLAMLPEKIRGFGHVKRANAEMAKREEQRLLQQFEAIRNPAPGRITDVA